MHVCSFAPVEIQPVLFLGAALIAFEMFSELSKAAANLSETQLSEELEKSAEYVFMSSNNNCIVILWTTKGY